MIDNSLTENFQSQKRLNLSVLCTSYGCSKNFKFEKKIRFLSDVIERNVIIKVTFIKRYLSYKLCCFISHAKGGEEDC